MITDSQPFQKIIQLQNFQNFASQSSLEELRRTVYSQQSTRTPKTITKQRNQAKLEQDKKQNEFFQTTSQGFFGNEFKLNKFQQAIQVIQQDQNKECQNLEKKKDSQSQTNSQAPTDRFFDSMDKNFKMKLFLEKFSGISQDMIVKIVNENFDYFLHFFENCFCYTCECGFCQCDFIKKSQKNIKYQGGYQTMYGSQFKKKDFDKQLLTFVADKVDHLWSNIPTDYQTTNQKFFSESGNGKFKQLSDQIEINKKIEKLFADHIDMKTTSYQNQFKDTSKVKQCLNLYRNVNQIPPMGKIKLYTETETNQQLNAKKIEKIKRLQTLEFKVPFARQSNTFSQREMQTASIKNYNQMKNKPIKNSLVNLVSNDKIQFQTSRLKQVKGDQNCFQYSKQQKQEIKDLLLQKIQQSLKN